MENIFKSQEREKDNFVERNYYVIEWNDENKFKCSPEFEKLTGFNADEINLLPLKHHSLSNEGDHESLHNSVIDHLSRSNDEKVIDVEIQTKDGKNMWFREFVKSIIAQNNSSFESILFNITDFKENEIKLNEIISSKSKLNSSKDTLISIISHDLRAPFSSLLGFSEILLNEPNLSDSERTEYLQYIYDASKIQLQMVNHLMDWTRLQTGTIKFNPHRLDIKDIIDNSVSVLTGSSIRKDIEIKVNAISGIYVVADEKLITQVITNLLSNALKFTPSGKKITVSVDLYGKNMVEVTVSDEGVGIEEEHHDKIFKIDSKFSKIGTNGEKGSGYGLALVKEIVEKHNGKIWFYSQKNKGSEFHFTLPKSEDIILIVEEYEDLHRPYKKMVDEDFSSYSLMFAKNGFEAHNVILQNIPSILITYHEMPLMNGIQLVSALREKDTQSRVLVIVLGDNLPDHDFRSYDKLNVNFILPINTSIDEIKKILDVQLH